MSKEAVDIQKAREQQPMPLLVGNVVYQVGEWCTRACSVIAELPCLVAEREPEFVLVVTHVARTTRLGDRESAQSIFGRALCNLAGALRLSVEKAPLFGVEDLSRCRRHGQPFTTTVSLPLFRASRSCTRRASM